jgi:hypothetical protein
VLFAVFLEPTMILRPFWDMNSWIADDVQARQRGDFLT